MSDPNTTIVSIGNSFFYIEKKENYLTNFQREKLFHPVWRHRIGENLAVFRGPKQFINDLFIWIVDGFYEERKYYDYETGQCSAQCGHYEVLVHAEQEKMGCAGKDQN